MFMLSTLHLTPDSTRFFLVPDGQILPPGEFVVRTLDKREMRVSEDALREFEIPQKEAHGLLREEMKQALKQAKDAFVSSIGPDDEDPTDPAPQAEKLLRDLLGWPVGSAFNEQNLANGLRPLLTLLSETLTVAASADPAAQAQAQTRLADLRGKLEGYGFSLGEHKIEDLPAKLAAWREAHPSADEQEHLAALLKSLGTLQDGLSDFAAGVETKTANDKTED